MQSVPQEDYWRYGGSSRGFKSRPPDLRLCARRRSQLGSYSSPRCHRYKFPLASLFLLLVLLLLLPTCFFLFPSIRQSYLSFFSSSFLKIMCKVGPGLDFLADAFLNSFLCIPSSQARMLGTSTVGRSGSREISEGKRSVLEQETRWRRLLSPVASSYYSYGSSEQTALIDKVRKSE